MPSLAEYRQRWRLAYARRSSAAAMTHREFAEQLDERLQHALPIAGSAAEPLPPRLVLAAPLPAGMLADRELADLFVAERLTAHEVRRTVGDLMPDGYELVDCYDVWMGEPSIAGQVVASEYVAELDGATADGLEPAILAVRGAEHVDRIGKKEGKAGGNLRPFILGLAVARDRPGDSADSGRCRLWMRLRHHQEMGTGRPEEVLAALGRILERDLRFEQIVRERLWLSGDLAATDLENDHIGDGDLVAGPTPALPTASISRPRK